jgi:septal ring factor EnvC (AmiA/AmiB activator)
MPILSELKAYIYAGIAALILGLSITIYVQHVRLGADKDRIKAVATELNVSNQSVTDLTKALEDVKNQLAQKERDDLAKQATIEANLKSIAQRDRSLEAVEAQLKNRKSDSNCPIPKDLQDAWNTL